MFYQTRSSENIVYDLLLGVSPFNLPEKGKNLFWSDPVIHTPYYVSSFLVFFKFSYKNHSSLSWDSVSQRGGDGSLSHLLKQQSCATLLTPS